MRGFKLRTKFLGHRDPLPYNDPFIPPGILSKALKAFKYKAFTVKKR
jgi:hypothetical protein